MQTGSEAGDPHAVASEPTAADLDYMRLAIELAAEAGRRGDVPIGASIVRDDKIVAVGS